jgi:hypothetical protein
MNVRQITAAGFTHLQFNFKVNIISKSVLANVSYLQLLLLRLHPNICQRDVIQSVLKLCRLIQWQDPNSVLKLSKTELVSNV